MNLFFGKVSPSNAYLIFSVATLALCLIAIYTPEQSHNIMFQIHVNEQDIKTLDDPRQIKLSTIQFFKSIDFPSGKDLRHSSNRPVGFGKNFFISIQSEFEVLKEGNYDFSVNSDDGYRLVIDGNKVGEFLGDRPANNDQFKVLLTTGKHKLLMDYFQGFGNAALELKYRSPNTNKYTYFGINSEQIRFIPITE